MITPSLLARKEVLFDVATMEGLWIYQKNWWCTPSYTDKIFLQFFMPVLVANQKCDCCQFYWPRGYLDVAMVVIYY